MIRVGVSACLLGRTVRHDGRHKRDAFLCDVLGPHVEWVPICPEVELGLGTPRPPIRLERRGRSLRLIMPSRARDLTGEMRAYAERRVEALGDLCGYVLKSRSPSCGLEGVPVEGGGASAGRFAAALRARWPELPVEEETGLADLARRDAFLERILACDRLRRGTERRAFELQLLSRSPAAFARLPRVGFGAAVMAALRRPATRAGHARALRRAARELPGIDLGIAAYARGLTPLSVPITLLRQHAQARNVKYLLGQTYLDPHPCSTLSSSSAA